MALSARLAGVIQSCPPDTVEHASYQMDGDGTESKSDIIMALPDPSSNNAANIVRTTGAV